MNSFLCAVIVCFIVSVATDQTCSDGSSCDDSSTCCLISETTYGCCPLVDAVCCDDMQHCCPSGYTCLQGVCFRSPKDMAHTNITNVVCPGGEYTCPDDNTCCPAGDVYSCCPLPGATCCSDGAHCCPSGTTCDLAHQTCNVPIVKIAGTASRHQPTMVVCPGGEYSCPDGNTCCLLPSGEYGCCPLPDAVCCDDKIHCCPSGYTCNGASCSQVGIATPTQTASVPMTLVSNPFALGVEASDDDIDCPDGKSTCPDGNTCCMLPNGQYGCCPLPQAACCPDHIHCCPEGSQCDVANRLCQFRGSEGQLPSVVPWVTKVPAIPRRLADDHEDYNAV